MNKSVQLIVANAVLGKTTVCGDTEGRRLPQPGVTQYYLKADTAPRLRSLEEFLGQTQVNGEGRRDKIVSAIRITRSKHLFQQIVIGHLCVPGVLRGTGDPVVERRGKSLASRSLYTRCV